MENKIKLNEMYDNDEFVQPYLHYYLHYNICPSKMILEEIDKIKVLATIKEIYQINEEDIIKSSYYDHADRVWFTSKVLIDLKNYCHVYIYSHGNYKSKETIVEILHCHQTPIIFLNQLQEIIISCKISDDFIPEINLICKYDNLFLNSFEISRVEIDLEKNYNEDFIEIDKIIKERLNKPKGKGIVLLHGIPGTGKTNYVRHLLSTVKKKMIYLPPDLAHEIGNPGFLTFLTDHADAILIIEDAETVVMERLPGSQGAISNLLNLCDGLLSDCLNIQVVCSFNTDISKIDAALLRKGRLIAKYEFTHLLIDKAKALSAHLGFTNEINAPMTLSEIYNQDEKQFSDNKVKVIGFGRKKELN